LSGDQTRSRTILRHANWTYYFDGDGSERKKMGISRKILLDNDGAHWLAYFAVSHYLEQSQSLY
jgi:hypothetical protein